MDSNEEQNTGTSNGNAAQTNGNPRTAQIAHMSLYERQAVQALQALQRQPNAAQYFQQLMLQQQISSAQLQNLAAVQQATLAASRQSNTPSNGASQTTANVNLNTASAAGGTTPRPHIPVTCATTTLNQSVLIGGNSAGQGQMYLRVNRSLRAPLASQFIFMPGGTATATVATVAQAKPQQQQQHEANAANGNSQTDNDQVQNLTLHHATAPRTLAVKSEFVERKDGTGFGQTPQQQQQVPPQQQGAKPFNPQSNLSVKTVTPAASVAPTPSSPALPLSQLLLSPSSAPVILVPTSNVSTSTQGYPIASVTPKANVNTQTLVVQPLQQATADKGPVPIQPKTPLGHRLPMQLPPRHPTPILPAPPSSPAAAQNPLPHVPVQLVGARQSSAGGVQAVALAPIRSSATQEQTVGPVSAPNNSAANMTKPLVGSLKRKSDCDAPSELTSEPLDCISVKDAAPPLSPAPTKDSALPVAAAAAFTLPPTLSLPPPLSRVGLGEKERAPLPQAVVKPQVLTHLIEGFVIQEGAEPFPVAGLLKDRDFSFMAFSENGPALLKCEFCGNLAPASQFRGSKRFCSNTCAKRTSRGRSGTGLTPTSETAARRKGTPRRSISDSRSNKIPSRHVPIKYHSESSHSEELSSDGEEDEDDSLSPSSSRSCSRAEHSAPQSDCSGPGGVALDGGSFLSSTPGQWSVEEVCRFISSLQGCEELAAHFLSQEIDGQALLLLREDHLISTMNIKLGPALKICASINSLRD